jgi:pyrroloquinoline quinone (PQQ) biosynthesis protein C
MQAPCDIARESGIRGRRRLRSPAGALSFAASVHAAQKRTGLWLPEHPFVHAVRAGLATRDELGQWVRQVYCITRSYGATLLSLTPPPPVGVWLDPWSDLELLFDLGGALGISPRELRSSEPGLAARGIQIWLGHHLSNPSRHIAAQACWALAESMSPEAGANLADGAKEHFGLKSRQLRYFRNAMKSRQHGDRYAATLLDQIPLANWPAIHSQAMLVSGLLADLYGSIRGVR